MLLAARLADYITFIKFEKGLAAHSVEMYQSRLRHFVWHWLPGNGYPDPDLSTFTAPVLRRYLHAAGAKGLRPRTIRGMFCPIRSFGDYLVEKGIIAENPARTIALPKKDAPDRKYVSDQELVLMMSAIERLASPQKAAFLRALFSVLINCGPRAQELLDMRVSDFSPELKTLVIPHGKGDKARVLHPSADPLAALAEWMIEREAMGCRHDWLWSITVSRRLGYDGLRALLEEVKCLAGLKGRTNIHCHSIRRAFAQRMLTNDANIKAIQSAMGHSNPETTFEYLSMGEREAKVMAHAGALSRPAPKVATAPPPLPSPEPSAPPKSSVRASFVSHRRRTPAK